MMTNKTRLDSVTNGGNQFNFGFEDNRGGGHMDFKGRTPSEQREFINDLKTDIHDIVLESNGFKNQLQALAEDGGFLEEDQNEGL